MKLVCRVIWEIVLWSGILALLLLGAVSLFMRAYLSSDNGWLVFFAGFSLVATSLLITRFDKRARNYRLASSLGLLGIFFIGLVLIVNWGNLTLTYRLGAIILAVVPVGFAVYHLVLIGSRLKHFFPK